jgi:hypothetical protein
MAKQTINIGAAPNDGTGTPLRTSFDYTNQNFTELYTALGGGVGLPGSTTQVIFNDGGTNLAGDSGFTFNKTTDALTISGPMTMASSNVTGGTIPANGVYLPAANTLEFAANSLAQYRIAPLGVFSWYDGAGGTRMTLAAGGNLLIGTTTNNANGGVLQLKSGITFPATQVAATDVNTLDDYEEGTFTPVIVGSTSAGVGTYTFQKGTYTKIGNVVTFQIYIGWSAHTGTGDLTIGTLPFVSNSTTNQLNAVSIGLLNNITLPASSVPTAFVYPGSTSVLLYQFPLGGGASSGVAIDTAGSICVSGTYFS